MRILTERIFAGIRVAAYFFVAAGATAMIAVNANGQDRSQTRSMVISKGGIVASESPLASQAGVRILERGGNAVDAAIATNAMMGVVEPMMNGIGGDLFVIVYDAKANKLYGLNASGWAPKGLTIEYLQKLGLKSMPQSGVNSITVPGSGGWMAEIGGQVWKEEIERGFGGGDSDGAGRVSLCRNGSRRIGRRKWSICGGRRGGDELYLPGDHAPKVGDVFKNPELAASLAADCGAWKGCVL